MANKKTYSKDPAQIQKLNEMQRHVTQESGTEPRFRNEFWKHNEEGLYVDIVSGEPLFSSLDKFDSSCGWPSFMRPLEGENVTEHTDVTHGMKRVEVRSKHGDSHLGHVFDDGPPETGLRYCINSASLRFIPKSAMAGEGYEEYLKVFEKKRCGRMKAEKAILAGGCFWGVEDLIRKLPGVVETRVGYTGGDVPHATYENHGTHAEGIEVVFDADKLSYRKLLEFFFQIHDPTTENRQGNDRGLSYRSAIFYETDEQKKTAQTLITEMNASGKWPGKVVTEVAPLKDFWLAETYHQDYLLKNPGGYTCHWVRPDWRL